MIEHEHAFEVMHEERAPTGPPPEHTKFMVMRCACGAVQIFPYANWRLTTEAYKTEFLSHLYAHGYILITE